MLGHLLKILFKNDDFTNAVSLIRVICLWSFEMYPVCSLLKCVSKVDCFLVIVLNIWTVLVSLQLLNSYVMSSREFCLNTAACRLLQNIMPGLETAVVFQEKVGPPPTTSPLSNQDLS